MSQQAHAERRREEKKRYACVCCVLVLVCVCFFFANVLHGSFLALLQSLPVFLQGADGVPRLATSPPQRAVSQNVLRVGFYYKDKGQRERHAKQRMLIVMLAITV